MTETNHATIYDALAAAQAEFDQASKNGKANYGRYATLDEILRAVRPALNRHGIYLFQRVEAAQNGLTVETLVGWKSETLSSGKLFMPTSPVKGGNAAQAMGSARTYACRYSLSSFLGIAADDDDDGQSAAPRGDFTDHRAGRRQDAQKRPPQPPAKDEYVLTQDTVDAAKEAAESGMAGYTAFWKAQSKEARKALVTSGWHEQLKAMATEADKEGAEQEKKKNDEPAF